MFVNYKFLKIFMKKYLLGVLLALTLVVAPFVSWAATSELIIRPSLDSFFSRDSQVVRSPSSVIPDINLAHFDLEALRGETPVEDVTIKSLQVRVSGVSDVSSMFNNWYLGPGVSPKYRIDGDGLITFFDLDKSIEGSFRISADLLPGKEPALVSLTLIGKSIVGLDANNGPIGGMDLNIKSQNTKIVSPVVNSLLDLKITDGSLVWPQGTVKKFSWETFGSVPYIDVILCQYENSKCFYFQKNIANTGSTDVKVISAPVDSLVYVIIRPTGKTALGVKSNTFFVKSNDYGLPFIRKGSVEILPVSAPYEVSDWPAGGPRNVSWDDSGVGRADETVGLYFCDPEADSCTVFTEFDGSPLNKLSPRPPYVARLGSKVLTNPKLAPYISDKNFRVKVCPTDVNGNPAPSSRCAFSKSIKIYDITTATTVSKAKINELANALNAIKALLSQLSIN